MLVPFTLGPYMMMLPAKDTFRLLEVLNLIKYCDFS